MNVMLFLYLLDQLYPTMIQIFFTFRFLWWVCICCIATFFILWSFLSPDIVISKLLSSVKSINKLFLGIPLFSLLSLVYSRIRFITKEFKVNTQKVLDFSALTGKPLQLHRPSRVVSCLPDWVPDSMADPWIKVSRLSGMPSPKQQTVLLDERKGFFVFFVNKRFPCPLLASLGNWIEVGA